MRTISLGWVTPYRVAAATVLSVLLPLAANYSGIVAVKLSLRPCSHAAMATSEGDFAGLTVIDDASY